MAEINYFEDQDVRRFYDYTTGRRFSTGIVRNGKFANDREKFDATINGPQDPAADPLDTDRGFKDYQICAGDHVKSFNSKDESTCGDYCHNESAQSGAT